MVIEKAVAVMKISQVLAKVSVLFGVVALGMPAVGASAGESAYPPDPPYSPGPFLIVDPNPVGAGKSFEATVLPCAKGTVIPFTFEGQTTNVTCTDPEAIAKFTAPSKAGVYVVSARLNGRTLVRDVQVTSTGGGLPNTGSSNPSTLLMLATSAVLAGGLTFVVAHRRRSVIS